MNLLSFLYVLVVVAIATPQQIKMEEKELDFLRSEMKNMKVYIETAEKARKDTEARLENVEKSKIDIEERLEERLANVEKAKNDTEERLAYLEEISKLNVIRTCDEMSQFGITASNYYFVDPDGPLIGSDPFRVYCDFSEDGMAVTEVTHDSEELVEVGHCEEAGCYSHKIIYSAPEEQIQSLISLSSECQQTIRYDCLLAPLMANDVNFAFWLDKSGEKNIYWHGANKNDHVCACYYEEDGCLDQATKHTKCNCDSDAPEMVQDIGSITNKTALPISQLNFGGLHYEMQQAFHSLGRLRCWGKAKYEEGTSCAAMKRSGQYHSGFFNIRKNETSNSRVVFCNQTVTPGYEDNGASEEFINSAEDHIEMVEKNIEKIRSDVSDNEGKISMLEDDVATLEMKSSFCGYQNDWFGSHTDGYVITYDDLIVEDNNIDGASFSISNGQFTAGLKGVYNVHLSIGAMYEYNSYGYRNEIYLRLNGANIAESELLANIHSPDNEIGGRSMLVHMERGDTLDVYGRSIGDISYITFCVSLVK